jgi:7-carboxy-7-deazaguanine synthase
MLTNNLSHSLRVSEIFYSIQGESLYVGLPTVFIRLTGCPLRCHYCDTTYAFSGGKSITIENICQKVADYQVQYVTVTGGEPLAQKGCTALLTQLCEQGYNVSLETSGAIDISNVDLRVIKVVDFKTPASGEVEKNSYKNINYLSAQDQIKIVICDREDYEWAKSILAFYQLTNYCTILFSPSHDQLPPNLLAEWILEDKLPVRLQLQIHKYIWGDMPGR